MNDDNTQLQLRSGKQVSKVSFRPKKRSTNNQMIARSPVAKNKNNKDSSQSTVFRESQSLMKTSGTQCGPGLQEDGARCNMVIETEAVIQVNDADIMVVSNMDPPPANPEGNVVRNVRSEAIHTNIPPNTESVISITDDRVENGFATLADLKRMEDKINNLVALLSSQFRPETRDSSQFTNSELKAHTNSAHIVSQALRAKTGEVLAENFQSSSFLPGNSNVNPQQLNTRHLQFWNFYKHDPHGWFRQLEDLFFTHRVTEDEVKFNFVGRHLHPEIHQEIQFKMNTLVRGQKYVSIKNILIERYAETPEQRLNRLFKGMDSSSRKPSDLLAEMVSLAQDRVPRSTVVALWKSRLPPQIQMMIWNYSEEQDLVKSADMAFELLQQSNNISALSSGSSDLPSKTAETMEKILAVLQKPRESAGHYRGKSQGRHSRARSSSSNRRAATRNRSSSRSPAPQASSGRCMYHSKYAKRAQFCILPCSWKRGPDDNYVVKKSKDNHSEN